MKRIQKTNGSSTVRVFLVSWAVLTLLALLAICISKTYGTKKPVEEREKPQPQQVETSTVGNSSFIKIGKLIENDENDPNFAFTLRQIQSFEANHPNLRVMGQQVIVGGQSGGYFIYGVVLRHEPLTSTNAPAPPEPAQFETPSR